MKKTLLMTTAIVALVSATNVYAEDEYITEDISINQDTTITEENAGQCATTGNINVSGGTITATGDSGLAQLNDGTTKNKFEISGGTFDFSAGAGIYAEGNQGQYNTTAADIDITGGNFNIKNGGEITLPTLTAL